jgi:hypothetical protein
MNARKEAKRDETWEFNRLYHRHQTVHGYPFCGSWHHHYTKHMRSKAMQIDTTAMTAEDREAFERLSKMWGVMTTEQLDTEIAFYQKQADAATIPGDPAKARSEREVTSLKFYKELKLQYSV